MNINPIQQLLCQASTFSGFVDVLRKVILNLYYHGPVLCVHLLSVGVFKGNFIENFQSSVLVLFYMVSVSINIKKFGHVL